MPRKAVPLTDEELAAVERARAGAALTALAGAESTRSQAAALHALVALGLQRVRDHDLATGYAALAATRDDEDRAYAAAIRGRRRGGAA